MQTSPRLSLSYIQPQQAQKHVTANESFRRLDAIVQMAVKSMTTAAEPGSPSDGDCYILPAGKTGAAWGAMTDGAVAYYVDGAWMQLTPRAGWRAHVEDTGQFHAFDGAEWKGEAALGAEAVFGKLTVVSTALLQNAVISDGDYQTFTFDTYSSGASFHAPYLQSRRARGTAAAPAATVNGDTAFSFDIWGHDGTNFVRLGQFGFGVGGAVSTGVVPGSLSFKLADAGGVLGTVFSIAPSGNVGVGAAAPTARLQVEGAVRVKSYAKASLPSASGNGAGAILYVSDEAGGAVLAFSDGTNWRRVTDRAVVS